MRKRLIFRVDDVGYTPAYDMGLYRVFEAGIGGSADVMFDAGDAPAALRFLKERPWISVGWHRHLWEGPVLPPEEVPSLVDERGRFKWGHRKQALMAEATYDDAFKEFDAEMQLCHSILGRYPDVAGAPRGDNELERAYKDVLDKYHLVYGFFSTDATHFHPTVCDDKYKDLHIISLNIQPDNHDFGLHLFKDYDPVQKMMGTPVWTEDEEIFFYGWHPGYCDDHIMAESTCNLHRCKELQAALSDEYRRWIIENHVELISFRDALYGTNELQDHLKAIHSPLWVGGQ